jgi:hypothetical protein
MSELNREQEHGEYLATEFGGDMWSMYVPRKSSYCEVVVLDVHLASDSQPIDSGDAQTARMVRAIASRYSKVVPK